MRASFKDPHLDVTLAHIEAAPGTAEVRSLGEAFAQATSETTSVILGEAAKFARAHLYDLNDEIDSTGGKLVDGRVVLPQAHKAAWQAFAQAGWTMMEQGAEWGGQGLPRFVVAASQEVFDRACMAFGMLATGQRSACRLIGALGTSELKAEWLPRITEGDWTATMCISEPDAGSDIRRLRSNAREGAAGEWLISGEKCWISYGDHNLGDRIGHCVLALSGPNELSLFLVPDSYQSADGLEERNSIQVRRVEHKMGLHGSPTCVLGFEDARGILLGERGRGLPQMFLMITNMRLSVGVTGAALAGGCVDTAFDYAESRLQGQVAGKTVPIIEHLDIQNRLFGMASRTEMLRGLIFALANQADLVDGASSGADVVAMPELVQWLLPIVKTIGGETAFNTASEAMQVLGGAGYTREWPVEQALRDARVLTIFEGTSGIQALDLVHRRLLRDEGGLATVQRLARQAGSRLEGDVAVSLETCLDLIDDAAAWLRSSDRSSRDIDAGATPFLQLAALGAMGWVAARLAVVGQDTSAHRYLATTAEYFLLGVGNEAKRHHGEILAGSTRLRGFSDLKRA